MDAQVVVEDQHKIITDEAFENPDLNQSALENYVPPSPASSTHSVYHPPDITNQSDSEDSDFIPGNVFSNILENKETFNAQTRK